MSSLVMQCIQAAQGYTQFCGRLLHMLATICFVTMQSKIAMLIVLNSASEAVGLTEVIFMNPSRHVIVWLLHCSSAGVSAGFVAISSIA